MKNTIIVSVVIFFTQYTLSQDFKLKGKIDGLENDTIFINVNTLDVINNYTDTVIATDGEFYYICDLKKFTVLMIQFKSAFEPHSFLAGSYYLPQSKRILVFSSPNDTVYISGNLTKNAIEYSIISSEKLNAVICERHNSNLKTYIEKLKLERKLKPGMTDSEEMQEYLNNKDTQRNVKINFIAKNPNEDLSAFYLIGSARPDEFVKMYDNLSESVKMGVFKEMLESRMLLAKQKLGLSDRDRISNNIPAPDFNVISLKGESVSLSNYRGKYLVLDFWGSWCAPCLKGIPKMKEFFKKYSSEIEYIGIACRDSKANVEKVVKDYKLNWIQVLDISSNDIAGIYKVTAWPTKVLIDDKGYVVDVFIGESDEFYKKIDELFKN